MSAEVAKSRTSRRIDKPQERYFRGAVMNPWTIACGRLGSPLCAMNDSKKVDVDITTGYVAGFRQCGVGW